MCPYTGVRLSECFPEEPAEHAAREMAETGGDWLRRLVVQNTPIDTGHLRESWRTDPVRTRRTPLGVEYRATVATNVDYAPYVEHGTGLWGPEHKKYLIVPRKPGGVLHWVDATGHHFASKVMHPGSPGQYMMASGLAKMEVMYALVQHENLAHWAHEQEAEFAAGQTKSPIL